jgi:phage shock protein A
MSRVTLTQLQAELERAREDTAQARAEAERLRSQLTERAAAFRLIQTVVRDALENGREPS